MGFQKSFFLQIFPEIFALKHLSSCLKKYFWGSKEIPLPEKNKTHLLYFSNLNIQSSGRLWWMDLKCSGNKTQNLHQNLSIYQVLSNLYWSDWNLVVFLLRPAQRKRKENCLIHNFQILISQKIKAEVFFWKNAWMRNSLEITKVHLGSKK